MCDTPMLPCQVCGKRLPVHIGDFCTARKNIGVRCGRHKPKQPGWTKFSGCSLGKGRPFVMYLAYIGPAEELEEGYGIGDAGDIVPNCFEYEEESCTAAP